MLYAFNGKTIRSSIGIDDWSIAKNIEIYNDNMLRDGYRNTDFRKDKILWVPYHLLNCPAEDINTPALPNENGEANLAVEPAGSRIFPIFGKKYEHVPLVGDELRGKVYFIESGHGGPDPGAMVKLGKHTLCEDEYAYDVALRLVRNLVAHGATAYMITRDPDDGIRDDKYLKCDSDEVVWGNKPIKVRQKRRLFQRSNVINELYDNRQIDTIEARKQLEELVKQVNLAKKEQTEKKLDTRTFSIYWVLKTYMTYGVDELSKKVSALYDKYPDWMVNGNERRDLRLELYGLLLKPLGKQKVLEAMEKMFTLVVQQ